MTPERWRAITEIFHGVISREAPARDAYLAKACTDDALLRAEVEAMIGAHEDAGSFGSAPVVASAIKQLVPGTQLGAYRIEAWIGAGGMGEVYRARDTKLGRDVALKILSDSFTHDSERLARFHREAHVLAALNHPHIGAIYGLDEANGQQFLVLELIDGETLADRLAKGPLAVDEALPMAKQIAEALEAAHEKGIIHRDLKPANIALTKEGNVKVLDFGLAKATEAASGVANDLANSPTPGSPAVRTGVGMILGTAAYMSPEQAKGRAADKRSDVWGFGCLLYEMLTGKRAFAGEDVPDTLAAVLMRDPDLEVLPSAVPPAVRTLIQRSLVKDRTQRIADISVVQYLLAEAASLTGPGGSSMSAAGGFSMPAGRRMVALASATLVGAISVAFVWYATHVSVSPRRVSRLQITPPTASAVVSNGVERDVAITPDGTRVVYTGANGTTLFVRPLDQLDPTPLTGLGSPRGPFISPDGQWVGFIDGATTLKKVAITGGPAVTICVLDGNSRGASWGADGMIVFATTNFTTGLQRVNAGGGEPTVLTRPDRARGEADHLWPEFLPGRQAVLFTIASVNTLKRFDQAQIAVLDLRTGRQTILIRGGTDAHYLSSGHLLYGTGTTLRAVAFDLERLAVSGTPVPVFPEVVTTPMGATGVAATNNTLVYLPGVGRNGTRTLVWVARLGGETPIAAPPRLYAYPRISPDGTRVVVSIEDQDLDLWMWELAHATLARITFDGGFHSYPVWTPDGRRMFFSSWRAGPGNLYGQMADGTGTIERLTQSSQHQDATSVSPDGKYLLFSESGATTAYDIMQITLDGTREVTPLVQTAFNERNGEISPDGRWLAYEANDSGPFEIYVRPYPNVDAGHWQVSTGGGTRPVWARGGRELFYMSPSGAVMRVGLEGGATWRATAPTKLLNGPYFASGANNGRTYDVTPNGERFLMIKQLGAVEQTGAPTSLVVIQNFGEELKARVPTK